MADTNSGRATKASTSPQAAPTGKDEATKATVASDANPTGEPDVSTGPVGTPEVIDAQEHVLGDDPRRVAHHTGYHDSLTGRPIDENGNFTEESMEGQGPVPKHRIVSDNWPTEREKIDDATKRAGNEAPSK